MIDCCSLFDNIGSLKAGETFYKLQSLSILTMYNHCCVGVEVRVISRKQNNYFKVFLNYNAFLGFQLYHKHRHVAPFLPPFCGTWRYLWYYFKNPQVISHSGIPVSRFIQRQDFTQLRVLVTRLCTAWKFTKQLRIVGEDNKKTTLSMISSPETIEPRAKKNNGIRILFRYM